MKRLLLAAFLMLPVLGFAQGWKKLPDATAMRSYASGGVCQYHTDVTDSTYPGIIGVPAQGCPVGVYSYSGGVWDSSRHCLVIWGGGHNSYGGNEVYCMTLTAMQRLTNFSLPGYADNPIACTVAPTPYSGETNADGTPVSVHSYGGLAFVPPLTETSNHPRMITFAGKLAGQGCSTHNVWDLNLDSIPLGSVSTPEWTLGYNAVPSNGYWGTAKYDPGSHTVLMTLVGQGNLYKYQPGSHTFSLLKALNSIADDQNFPSIYESMAVNPTKRLLVGMKQYGYLTPMNRFTFVDLTNVTATGTETLADSAVTWTTSIPASCSGAINNAPNGYLVSPTILFDRPFGVFLIYPGYGPTVYLFNPGDPFHIGSGTDTTISTPYGSIAPRTCVSVTYGSTEGVDYPVPTSPQSGVYAPYNRFDYAPELDKYVYSPNYNQVGWTLQLDRQAVGVGCTTITKIDKDCDGYGVGSPLGPDADDNDYDVVTANDGILKYGTLAAFYQHLGAIATTRTGGSDAVSVAAYNPTRYWVMSPTATDDTCTAHTFAVTPDPKTVTACKTINTVNARVVAGDMVIFRGGTYQPGMGLYLVTTGTAAHPITYIAYPGELPVIDFQNTGGFNTVNIAYIVWDGIKIQNVANPNAAFDGGTNYSGPENGYRTTGPAIYVGSRFRNMWFYNNYHAIRSGDGNSDFILEDSILRGTNDGNGSHDLYLGSRSNPSDNITIRRNIMYESGSYGGFGIGFQFNGRVTNMLVEGNLIYSNYHKCFSMEQGVSNSIIRNNVCWQNGKSGLEFYDYYNAGTPGQATCYDAAGNVSASGTYGICPWPQKNNVIENNTFYIGSKNRDGETISYFPCVSLTDSSSTGPHDYTGNVFRNNTCQNDSGGVFFSVGSSIGASYEQTTSILGMTLLNNFLYSSVGGNGSNVLRDITSGGTYYTWSGLGAISGYTASNNIAGTTTPYAALGTYTTPLAFNLRPKTGSQLLNAGAAITFTNDVQNFTRPSPPSIGAYELVAGSAPTTTYALTIACLGTGSGTTNPACGSVYNYSSGETATVTQSATTGSTFAGWSGDCSGTGSCSVVMNADKSVSATFNLNATGGHSVLKGGKLQGKWR